jgi:ubiquinone/menaquinone biosynthesis C-methylase UbiE
MGWFRKATARDSLAVTMAGVKLGDRFLSIGLRDPALIAALAVKSGLTGHACAVDADAACVSSGAADIEREGGLAEVSQAPWSALPFENGSFDIVVVRDVFSTLTSDDRRASAAEALRVLRGGGRVVVVESTKRARVDAASLTAALTAAGFAAVRVLAEAEHTIFVEGIKRA